MFKKNRVGTLQSSFDLLLNEFSKILDDAKCARYKKLKKSNVFDTGLETIYEDVVYR